MSKLAQPTKRIPDVRLAEMAQEIDEMKSEKAELEEEIKSLEALVMAELERRGTHEIDTNGWTILRVQAERVQTDFEGVVERLPINIAKQCVKTVIDSKAVAALVNMGKISADLVSQYSKVVKNSPYLKVSRAR